MPILVDPNTDTERVVSQADYEALRERTGRVFRRTDDGDTKLKLWDTIDQDWAKPVPSYVGFSVMLRMLTNKCSDCRWSTNTTNAAQDFAQHVRNVTGERQSHMKATPMAAVTAGGMGFRCSACSATYVSMGRCQMHIEGIKRQGSGHTNARLLLVRRYALEPSVSVATQVVAGPMASQVQQKQVERPRRRHHRNRRSRNHVNAS